MEAGSLDEKGKTEASESSVADLENAMRTASLMPKNDVKRTHEVQLKGIATRIPHETSLWRWRGHQIITKR